MNEIKFQNDGSIFSKGLFTENMNPVFKPGGNIECQEIIETYTFTSKKSYSPEECLNYCSGNSSSTWTESDIIESKSGKWIKDYVICLIIPCTDKNYYISIQKVIDNNTLVPTKVYNIHSNNKKFISITNNGILYCNEVLEGVQ